MLVYALLSFAMANISSVILIFAFANFAIANQLTSTKSVGQFSISVYAAGLWLILFFPFFQCRNNIVFSQTVL